MCRRNNLCVCPETGQFACNDIRVPPYPGCQRLHRSCLRSRMSRAMVEDAPRRTREKPSITQGINDDDDLFCF